MNQGHDPSEEEVTVVFADISGSTSLYQRVGNQKAHELISACLETLKSTVAEHDGEFVHSRGDDVVCTFANTDDAFRTVVEMLARTNGTDLLVHIGLDRGPVIRVRDDIFGNSVNVAARLSSLANENEALCGENTREAMNRTNQSLLQFFATRQLRGTDRPADIYRYATPSLDAGTQIHFTETPGRPRGPVEISDATVVELSFDGVSLHCKPGQKLTIGRSANNDLVIAQAWVSRQHAVVEVRNDHAYLHDVSSNGIYVSFAGQDPVLLLRETMLLPALCTLSPTNAPDNPRAALINCRVTKSSG